jgi:uncharacterized protein
MFGQLFGPSHNDRYAGLLKQLTAAGIQCAEHFRKTEGQDLAGVIELERRADSIVDEIHELLDNAFILRFDIPDAMRLADEIDDVIDGMRRVSTHIDIYKPILFKLRPEAIALMEVCERMMRGLHGLISMFSDSKLKLSRVREAARILDEAESEADEILRNAERALVKEYGAPGAYKVDFNGWDKLYQLLEEMTDDANNCAKLVLSLARKEA